MNLRYVHELLAAANKQRHGLLRLRGIQADQEVRLMAQAGLVEAAFGDGKEESSTSITLVTPAGQTFLRTFRDHPIPDEATVAKLFAASQVVLEAKTEIAIPSGASSSRVAPQ